VFLATREPSVGRLRTGVAARRAIAEGRGREGQPRDNSGAHGDARSQGAAIIGRLGRGSPRGGNSGLCRRCRGGSPQEQSRL